MRSLIFFSLIFTLSVQTNIQAQSDATTRQELQRAGLVFTALGYELTHELIYGSLRDDEYDTYSLTLRAGREYKITAGCDGDCGDIDLVLYDENGNLVDSDREYDDNPIVGVTPSWTGSFQVKVIMADCRVNPCRFGIAVYGE